MKIILFIAVALLFVGCQNASQPSTPQPTPSKPVVQSTPDIELNKPKEAIESYLKEKHDGWTLKGDTLSKGFTEFDESESVQFDIHLQKGKEDKVVTLVLKKFQDSEGKFYWLAYEPTKLEIAQIRLQKAKKNVGEEQFRLGIEEGTSNPHKY